MAIKPALNQFNGGEFSPELEGRYDLDKYNYSAKLCKNFIPTIEGSLKRRGGTHFVARAYSPRYIGFRFRINGLTFQELNNLVLTVNGEVLELSKGKGLDPMGHPYVGTFYYSPYIAGNTEEGLDYTISANGYITKSGHLTMYEDFKYYQNTDDGLFVVSLAPDNIEYTLNVEAPQGVEIRINGEVRSTYTGKQDELVSVTASYSEQSNSTTVKLDKSKTLVVSIIDNLPVFGDSSIITTSSPNEGNIYLTQGLYRVTLVGGGGGGESPYMPGSSPQWFNGGSGAGIDGVFNLPDGNYSWRCGQAQTPFPKHQSGKGSGGTSSFLKLGSVVIAEAFNGIGSVGGTYTLNKDYVSKIIISKNGNSGGSDNNFTGISIIPPYGEGMRCISFTPKDNKIDIKYNMPIDGYFSIVRVGD